MLTQQRLLPRADRSDPSAIPAIFLAVLTVVAAIAWGFHGSALQQTAQDYTAQPATGAPGPR